jgi:hypothetical protein
VGISPLLPNLVFEDVHMPSKAKQAVRSNPP